MPLLVINWVDEISLVALTSLSEQFLEAERPAAAPSRCKRFGEFPSLISAGASIIRTPRPEAVTGPRR